MFNRYKHTPQYQIYNNWTLQESWPISLKLRQRVRIIYFHGYYVYIIIE